MKTLRETIDEAVLKWYNEEMSHEPNPRKWDDPLFEHLISEEVSVGEFSCNGKIEINVYGDEGNIPHFHFRTTDREGCIEIKTLKPYVHGVHKGLMNRKECKELKKFLTYRPNKKGFTAKTNYELICDLWNICNPLYATTFEKKS